MTQALADTLGPGLTKPDVFNLTVTDSASGRSERFANVTVASSARRVDLVLAAESKLLRVKGALPAASPVVALSAAMDDLADAIQDKAVALAANPPPANTNAEDLAIAAARTKVEEEKQKLRDPVSAAEVTWAAAKQTLLDKQVNDPSGVAAAQTALDAASTALSGAKTTLLAKFSDGGDLTAAEFLPPNGQDQKKGLFALEQADLFNLLCIPPYKKVGDAYDVDATVVAQATSYSERRRAMYLIDSPSNWNDKDAAKASFTAPSNDFPGVRSKNTALFYPRIRQPNPLRDDRVEEFAPSGAIAGVFARTDAQRGVWKAPAGLEATLVGVPELEQNLTDAENGELNPLGINCLRAFPVAGRVVWGARTLRGADQLADEWKYIPVRRTALFIEESLYRGTQWVVFEPNDEPLWSQIRLNVGAFMNGLFRQGAFQGQTPREAYFVKCDKETTTQDDINLGIVNIVVGFAPLKPAEFVVIKLQQMAGQTQA